MSEIQLALSTIIWFKSNLKWHTCAEYKGVSKEFMAHHGLGIIARRPAIQRYLVANDNHGVLSPGSWHIASHLRLQPLKCVCWWEIWSRFILSYTYNIMFFKVQQRIHLCIWIKETTISIHVSTFYCERIYNRFFGHLISYISRVGQFMYLRLLWKTYFLL